MKKQLLTLLLITTTLTFSCKKDSKEDDKPKSLVGTKWESYSFTGSTGVKYYNRLIFKTDSQVEYFTTYIDETTMTSAGKATLTYSIDDPMKMLPKITITGNLNNVNGTPNPKDPINWVLTYTPELGSAKASLDMKGVYYTKY